MVAGPGAGLRDAAIRDPIERMSKEDTSEKRDFGITSELYLAVDPNVQHVKIQGIPPLSGRTTYPLLEQLVAAYEADRALKRAPVNHQYVPAKLIRSRLVIDDTTLRRCVLRVRRRVADLFERHCGLTIANDAVIQSVAWQGYRINPYVRVVAPNQILLAARHETKADPSRLATRSAR
jgi:hypothetical protein